MSLAQLLTQAAEHNEYIMRRKVAVVAGLVGSGYALAYAAAHRRRMETYTAARSWLNVPDDEDVACFLKEVGSLEKQSPVRTPATPESVAAFRTRYRAVESNLKTGDGMH